MLENWDLYKDLEYYPDRVCDCGCEGKIKVQPWHKYRNSIPRYVPGHENRRRKWSKDAIEKRKAKCKNRKFSDEHIKNLKKAAKKRKEEGRYQHSKETIEKIRQANKKPLDEKGHGLNCTCCICKTKRGEVRRNKMFSLPYPKDFNEKLKNLVRERDNHTCQSCGRTKEEEGKNLSVHHINYNKENLDPRNLITLCRGCNAKANFDKEEWEKVFREKILYSFGNKVLLVGDTHFSSYSPRKRVDNYFKNQIKKLKQTISICREHRCRAILQTGDFFDSPRVGNYTIAEVIGKLMFSGFDICTVAGQHDIVGHSLSTLRNSPLAVLASTGLVRIVGNDPYELCSTKEGIPVMIYGASFGEDIPKPLEDCYNILIAHKMIGNRPLWPGQELVNPRNFLRKYPSFDLVVTGDYHYRFIEKWNGRVIINPGALVRKTISSFDLEHEPAVVVFDILTKETEVIKLDVKPINEVFDLSSEVKNKEKNNEIRKELLTRLVERLKEGSTKLLNWRDILLNVMEERKTSNEVKEVIDQTLEEVKNGK